jgi:hypothetical protein
MVLLYEVLPAAQERREGGRPAILERYIICETLRNLRMKEFRAEIRAMRGQLVVFGTV